MDEATLLAELQELTSGKALRDPNLTSRVRVNLRAALQVSNSATSDELRARLTTLVKALDDVANNYPPKQRDEMRRAIRGVLGLDDEVHGDSAKERRLHLERLTGYSDRTIRRWEKTAFELLARHLAVNARQSATENIRHHGGSPTLDEPAESHEAAHSTAGPLTTAATDIDWIRRQKIKPTLSVYRTKGYYIINGRPLLKWLFWANLALPLLLVAFFAFGGGGWYFAEKQFDYWAAEANSVDAIPRDGSDARIAASNGRLGVHWTLVGRPGSEAIHTEFVPGNSAVKLTQIAGSLQIEQNREVPCPGTTIAWSISTGSKIESLRDTWTVTGGKVMATGSIGPSNPTHQLYVPISGHLDTFTISAHLTGAPCPYMGFVWHDPHVIIENRV